MNILAINWQDLENPQAGGAEIHITEILKRLVQKGHHATLFCSGFHGAGEEASQDGIRIVRRGGRFNFNWVLPFYLSSVLKNEKYDIVLEDLNKMPFFSPMFHKLPTLVIVHHFFGSSIFKETNILFGSYVLLGEWLVPRCYKRFPFLTISESSKQELTRKGVGPERITVINNGVDDALFENKIAVVKSQAPTVLYLGRIKKYKGVQHLIQAVIKVKQQVPNVKLKVVGSGDYAGELKRLVIDLKLTNYVEFTGFVTEQEKYRLLGEAWVSVYPSLKEGWGLTNIEANACGTPVVASNVPGLRDSVLDGKTGLLFKYGDVRDLAEKLSRILTDASLRSRLIDGGREWAQNFSWNRTARKFSNLLEQVVGEERED